MRGKRYAPALQGGKEEPENGAAAGRYNVPWKQRMERQRLRIVVEMTDPGPESPERKR